MDVRTFIIGDAQYELQGLGQRASAIAGAADATGAAVQARRAAAAAALASWRGPHAATFASQLRGLLGAGAALQSALLQRAAVLSAFPADPAGSAGQARRIDAAYAATVVPAPGAGGGAAAEPARLRGYADHSAGAAGPASAVAGEVHVRDVTGTVSRPRALTAAEQQAQLAAGTPLDVAVALAPEVRVLTPEEVRGLIGLRPVGEQVDALLTRAAVLASFATVVAGAFEAADTGLLDALAAVAPGTAALGQDTAAALAGRLADADATPAERDVAAGLLRDLAARDSAAVLAALDPDTVNRIVFRVDAVIGTDPDGADHRDATMGAFSGALSTALANADDATVAKYAKDLELSTTAGLVTSAGFDTRFSAAAFDALWVPRYWTENPLAEPHTSEFRMAALHALQPHPELVAQRALADPDLFDDLLSGWYPDRGALAARLLTDAFHDRVLRDLARDANDRASLLDSELAAVYAVRHTDRVNRPAGVALATIANLHFDEVAFIAEHGYGRGEWAEVERGELVDFYATVLTSDDAARAAGSGFAQYAVYRFQQSADNPGPGPLVENVASDARETGAIGKVLEDGIQQRANAEHARDQFWIGAGQQAAAITGGALVTSTGVGGVAAAAGGGFVSWIAGLGAGRLRTPPPPDGEGAHLEQQVMLQAALLKVAIDHPSFLDGLGPLPHELSDPKFLDDVLRGDDASGKALTEMVEADEHLDDRLTYLLEAAGA